MHQPILFFRRPSVPGALLFLGLWLSTPPSADAQLPRPALNRAAVALDVNTEAVKRLATVEDHVKERQWSQAILILQQVAAEHGNAMIEVSSRRYLNVSTYCNSVLANFPPEGLAVYREKHDAQARQWLETGLATRNRVLLQKIVRQSFISSSGDEALFWLGEWAWDRGNYPAARDYWRQLLELPNPPDAGLPQPVLRYPDSSYSQAQVVARIVLSHIMEGNQDLAKNWGEYLSQEFPEARGELAGRSGTFTEILAEVFKESRGWQFPSLQGEMPTFAGNPQRNHRHSKAPEVGGVQWQRSLPDHKYNPATPRRKAEPSLSYFPITVDNTAYFCDPERIYALDLLTGQPRWPRSVEGNLAEQDSLSAAVIYETTKLSDPRGYLIGQPRFTLTVHENRLYARMGSPITGQITATTSTSQNLLVCLDLTKEGKAVWDMTPEEVLAGLDADVKRQWAFEGAPVVAGGRVFVAMRQSHPQTEALVACLDAETGRPHWIRRVASALGGVAEQQNFISHLLVTLGENMVFYMPEFGVVTALDALTGQLLWAVTYPSYPAKESPILKEPREQGLTPGVFHQGVLYAAPTDSESILAISAKTGVLLWERQIPVLQDQIRHVLGVVQNKLVLSGNHLWILNATTGAIEFPAQIAPGRDPEFDGYGRGLIAGDIIYWPTRSTIEIRNLAGQRTKQPEPYPGGNLAIGGDLLLVAEPTRLVAYSNFAQLRKQQKERISQNPNAADPYWRLAQVEEAIGEHQEAMRLYEEAIAKATPLDKVDNRPLKALASQGRFRLLLRLGKQAITDGLPQDAVAPLREAVQSSQNPAGRGEALRFLGTALVQAKQIPEAAAAFQAILDEAALANLPTGKEADPTLGQFAKEQIAALIAKHGREVYAKFDSLAAEKTAERLKLQDLEGVEDILRQYPNALVTSETRHQLARLKRDQGDAASAIHTWQELLHMPASAKTRQAILWELGSTLEQQGYLRPARDIWRQLAREFPAASLLTEQGPRTATEFLSQRLQSENYRQLDQPAPALPLFRQWERDRTPGSNVILPEGEPPGPALATVLIDDRGLFSLDQSNGRTRWEKPLNNPVVWAGYGPTQLVLGTKNSLFAVALETGQTLWQVSFGDPEAPAPRFQRFQDQILVFTDNTIRGYEAGTGRPLWNVAPAGTLSETYHADEDFVLVQTENPLRVLVFETKTGKQLSLHRPAEPWISPPIAIQSPPLSTLKGRLPANRGFIAAMTNQRIHAFGAFDPLADPMWTFQGATSFANAPPRFWSEGENLLMLMDGDTLVRLAPETGKTLWFTPLSKSPLADPSNSILLEGEHIYAAESQTLSCLSLKEGQTIWKQSLPHAGVWALRKKGPLLFAAPLQSSLTDSQALIFQAQTGEPVQKLQIPPGIIDLTFHRAGSLVVTKDKLLGWGPMEYSSPTN